MPRNEEQCVVALWRGYVYGCFYARPPDADVALLVSPSFRIFRLPGRRRPPLEEDPAATGSLRVLEEQLVAEGWELLGRGPRSAWYALRFGKPERTTRREVGREGMAASVDGRRNGSEVEAEAADGLDSEPSRTHRAMHSSSRGVDS